LMAAADLTALLLIGLQLFRLRARMEAKRVELEAGVARLSELATRDDLTGLPNRHFVAETFEHLARGCRNSGEPCAVVLIDLDYFKQVNDTYGHAAGDQTLRAFALLASKHLRQVDVLSRWGGEEFLLVSPKTTAEGARISTARLRQALETIQVLSEAPAFHIRFSAGITEIAETESLEAALARSDIALYAAKEAGRNRSEVRLAA
jgi:diguanylate cyclase